MADAASVARAPDDATLLNTVRTGDGSAFDVLWQRHVHAVRLLAGELVATPADADYLVAEAFASVLDVTKLGGGPTDAFRPYMLIALRRAAASYARGKSPQAVAGQQQLPDPDQPLRDWTTASVEAPLIARAFVSLPGRWQAVLWHCEIEHSDAAEMAALFALGSDEIEVVAHSASKGLQQACLRLHASVHTRPECRQVADQMGGHLQDTLSEQSAAMVTEHLASCGECAAVRGELADLGATLRGQVAPVFLGPATASYLSGIASAAGTEPPVTAVVADSVAAPSPASRAGPRRARRMTVAPLRLPGTSGQRWAAAGIGAALLVVGVALGGAVIVHHTPGTDPGHHVAAGTGTSPGVGATPAEPQPSASPRMSPSASPSASPGAVAAPTPSSSPPPAAELSADISVSYAQQRGTVADVMFTVIDTGNAPSGEITASISLPSGTWLPLSGGHWSGQGGWSCQPNASGATCRHAGVSAGALAQGVVVIELERISCGQPVQLMVTSRRASASARPAYIHCRGILSSGSNTPAAAGGRAWTLRRR